MSLNPYEDFRGRFWKILNIYVQRRTLKRILSGAYLSNSKCFHENLLIQQAVYRFHVIKMSDQKEFEFFFVALLDGGNV